LLAYTVDEHFVGRGVEYTQSSSADNNPVYTAWATAPGGQGGHVLTLVTIRDVIYNHDVFNHDVINLMCEN